MRFLRLYKLGVARCALAALPAPWAPEPDQAPAAQVLVLDHNRLSALDVVCALPRLEKLSAAHNALGALPAGVHHLRKLRELNVASNQLAALPDALGACESLELIDAADNRIQVRL